MRGPKQIARGVARRLRSLGRRDRSEDQFHLIHAVKNELAAELHGVAEQLHEAAAAHESMQDQAAMVSTRVEVMLNELHAARDEVGFSRNDILVALEHMAPSLKLRPLQEARLEDIDDLAAAFLNYARSHRGPLADADLWINDPVVIEWRKGEARVGAVNERIVEQPFVYGALASLEPGSRVLDIGGGESVVALSLASMGHDVTIVEPGGYPFEHPNLTVARQTIDAFEAPHPVDAVVLLSAIEHFGLHAYTDDGELDPDADLAAMRRVHDLLAPGGMLVLTTPFGPAAVNDLERTYDADRLGQLLEGFEIDAVAVASRRDDTTWTVTGNELTTPEQPGHVAMVRAHRPA